MILPNILWGAASIGLFAGIWEALWAAGWADPRLLPPPHIFLGSIGDQAKFFNTVNRWQIGAGQGTPTPRGSRCCTRSCPPPGGCSPASRSRRCWRSGWAWRSAISPLFRRLTLPTITLLAPVSPIAWLPVAIFLFGIGNGPASSWW